MFLYFFSCYGAPLDLHSFPTRRSSDLTVSSACLDSGLQSAVNAYQIEQGFKSGWMTFRDRKSTRLNSSHVEISYAVFCMKKKRITSPHYPAYVPYRQCHLR